MKTLNGRNGMGAALLVACFGLFFVIVPYAWGITTVRVGTGFSNPVYAVSPPGDTERLFILEQFSGRIRILNLVTRQTNAADFLVLTGLAGGTEQGLLGMAFDPNYGDNGYFYVNLTVSGTGATEIRRYTVSGDPDIADATSQLLMLSYSQPQSNHNGGWIGFGPDGFLYIASGDGGGGNDSDAGHTAGLGNGQDKSVLLGKLLRIDVHGDDFPGDAGRNYRIPADNPFVGVSGADEIWAYGLRNPWRCSFDSVTGELYIADVGQGVQEEINVQGAGSGGGENYGWRVMEGLLCNFAGDPLPCNDPSFTSPIHVYNHVGAPDGGNAVTGGYVYRGPRTDLQGTYFFADYISNQIWTFEYDGNTKTNFVNRTVEMVPDAGILRAISSFGEDSAGNLYLLNRTDGAVFKILPEPVIMGDYDGDGFVNLSDLSELARLWQTSGCSWCGGFDFDGDLDVDIEDLSVFSGVWLQ